MSSSVKITGLLALASAVGATPHFQHQKFHHRAAYPVGGWGGASNGTASVAGATGATAVYGEPTTTIGSTSTSTQTIYSTVTVKSSPSPDAHQANVADASSSSVCGGTVTVTAKEIVTVTVTPGGGAGTPAASTSAGTAYGTPSSPGAQYPASSPASSPSSSKPAQYATPSKPAEYATPSQPAKYPVDTSSAAPSKTASTPAYSAPASATSSSPAASTSSSAPGLGNMYSGAKRGLAYNDAELCSTFGSSYGFGYNWGQVENNDIGTMFIPMMHKPSDSSASDWLANVDKAVKKGSTAVMGFNECDITSQCNLSPEAACSAWKEYMNPIKQSHPDVTIIGPSVSNGQAPLGLDWLTRFHSSCPDAKVDAGNIHFYDDYDEKTIDRFTAHIEQAAETYGKVWVTEFGLNTGTATEEQAASFLKDCMTYLDNSDKVQGYAWFMVGTGEYQLNSGSGLSAVGKVYAGSS